MDNNELREEELEVLRSIYEGDENFKEVSSNTFQYKIGEDEQSKSYVLQIEWGEHYPQAMPLITLDAFYNKHLLDNVKQTIVERLKEEAEMLLDTAMTYTLFEYAKENSELLLAQQPDTIQQASNANNGPAHEDTNTYETTSRAAKKEQLSKAQKRKMFDRMGNTGEMARGCNWVDVVHHLSQRGRPETQPTT